MQHDVKSAIAVFDKSAERTRPNAQTEAWKVLRDEIERLRDIEAAAALLAVERAEFGIRARKAEAALQAQGEPVAWMASRDGYSAFGPIGNLYDHPGVVEGLQNGTIKYLYTIPPTPAGEKA